MDFSLDETQQAVTDLAEQIFSTRITPEGLSGLGNWYDSETYQELAKAGLVGLGLGEDVGGGGMGIMEVAPVMEAMGRHVAPVPLWGNYLAAAAIDQFGSQEQRSRELPKVADASTILTVGIQEWHNDDYLSPTTQATVSKKTWQLNGTKIVVEFAQEFNNKPISDKILVTAQIPNSVTKKRNTLNNTALFLASMGDPNLTFTEGKSIRLQPVHEINFNGAEAELVGELSNDTNTTQWLTRRAVALLCAIQVGVLDKSLKMTAEYTATREQFGRPIATFQAVTQRLADQFINVNGARLTTAKALYQLSQDNQTDTAVDEAVNIAKWYCSHYAHEVAHTTQHVHGGAGVDQDYPLHRYTLWNKHLETSLGAGTQSLRKLGALLATG